MDMVGYIWMDEWITWNKQTNKQINKQINKLVIFINAIKCEYLDGFNQYGQVFLQDTEDAYELGMAIGMANGWIGLANGKWMNE